MSSRHLPVAPLTRAIVEADLESCRQKVEGFSSYCDELVQSVHTYAEQMQKKKGRKKAKEPVLVFPRRPSGRESLNITNLLGDTVRWCFFKIIFIGNPVRCILYYISRTAFPALRQCSQRLRMSHKGRKTLKRRILLNEIEVDTGGVNLPTIEEGRLGREQCGTV